MHEREFEPAYFLTQQQNVVFLCIENFGSFVFREGFLLGLKFFRQKIIVEREFAIFLSKNYN